MRPRCGIPGWARSGKRPKYDSGARGPHRETPELPHTQCGSAGSRCCLKETNASKYVRDANDNKRESERICDWRKGKRRSIAQTRLGVLSLKLFTVASHHPGCVAQRCEENKDDFHMVGGAAQRQGSRRPQPMYLASQACRKGWTCPRTPSPQNGEAV